MALEKDVDCPSCGETQSFYRTAAMTLHLGETKWRCPECGYGYVEINGSTRCRPDTRPTQPQRRLTVTTRRNASVLHIPSLAVDSPEPGAGPPLAPPHTTTPINSTSRVRDATDATVVTNTFSEANPVSALAMGLLRADAERLITRPPESVA